MSPARYMVRSTVISSYAISALVIAITSMASPCGAWGVTGHRYSNAVAIDCLPLELKPFYESNRPWIVRHAVDPDEWRRDNFALESPRHYIDLDYVGKDVADKYPQDYWVAVGLLGQVEVIRHGTVPWRIGEYYGKLVRAFRSRNLRAIIEISTWLGHYVSDAHVPFHCTSNYDGQLTGQKGIHLRFESGLLDQFVKITDLAHHDAGAIADPVASAFRWSRASLARCDEILASDRRGYLKDADYGYNYYTVFGSSARPIAIHCLEQSALDTASLWMSAWIAAGSPPMHSTADEHAGEPLDGMTHDPDLPISSPGAPLARP